MTYLRSGIVLFVCTTAVGICILGCLLVWTGNVGGWHPDDIRQWILPAMLAILTAPMSVVLATLAWCGRHQPLTDGIATLAIAVVAVDLIAGVVPTEYSEFGRGFDVVMMWAYGGIGLACTVPAYLITYFALHRTALLAAIAPPRKSKGPAEASP